MIVYLVIAFIIVCIGAYLHGARDSVFDDTGFNLIIGAVLWPIALPVFFFIWLGSKIHRRDYDF